MTAAKLQSLNIYNSRQCFALTPSPSTNTLQGKTGRPRYECVYAYTLLYTLIFLSSVSLLIYTVRRKFDKGTHALLYVCFVFLTLSPYTSLVILLDMSNRPIVGVAHTLSHSASLTFRLSRAHQLCNLLFIAMLNAAQFNLIMLCSHFTCCAYQFCCCHPTGMYYCWTMH